MARLRMQELLVMLLLSSLPTALGQFQFFEQMFSGGGHEQQHHHHQQQQGQEQQDSASDSAWYQQQWSSRPCSKYLCPGTLACVHFPHHCPCPFPDVEDKVELADGSAVCASKGGFKVGEMSRKVDLARKGLL